MEIEFTRVVTIRSSPVSSYFWLSMSVLHVMETLQRPQAQGLVEGTRDGEGWHHGMGSEVAKCREQRNLGEWLPPPGMLWTTLSTRTRRTTLMKCDLPLNVSIPVPCQLASCDPRRATSGQTSPANMASIAFFWRPFRRTGSSGVCAASFLCLCQNKLRSAFFSRGLF